MPPIKSHHDFLRWHYPPQVKRVEVETSSQPFSSPVFVELWHLIIILSRCSFQENNVARLLFAKKERMILSIKH